MTEEVSMKSNYKIMNKLNYILLILLPYTFVLKDLNNDIWFLLNSGRYVLESGIPHIEPFSIHQGFEFVMQQWLSASIFWVLYDNFGVIGLNSLVFICYLLYIYIFYKLCMRVSGNNRISYILTLLTIISLIYFMTQRPYLLSNLVILLEVYLLESYLSSNQKRYLYFLPLLSVLLINLHASMWPMMFVIMIPYIIDSFHFKLSIIRGQGYQKKLIFGVLLAMLISGFLNPYGIEAMTYLSRSYGHDAISNYIVEMRPLNINTSFGFFFYIIMLGIFLTYAIYRKGNTKLRYVLLSLGTAYMTLSSVRSFPFFAICGMFPLAYYLKDVRLTKVKKSEDEKIGNDDKRNKDEKKKRIKNKKKNKENKENKRNKDVWTRNVLRIAIMTLILVIASFFIEGTKVHYQQSQLEYKLFNDTIEYIKNEEQQNQVKLYTAYDDGGMAEFLGIPSYIDPRAEVFVKKNNKKADVMKEFYMLQSGYLNYKSFLDQYRFTHLIIIKKDILYTYLPHDSDYQVTYSNDRYTLYERK